MRFAALAVSALLAAVTVLPSHDTALAIGNEPSTSTIRIRLKGATLRVRCRGGDCTIRIVRQGTTFAVSVTRVRNGAPFTFERSVENPTNLAVETGLGNDSVSLVDVVLPGFLRIGTSAGNDVIDVSASTGQHASIYPGAGDDVVRLALGTIGGHFRLKAHAGNDDVTVVGGVFARKAGFDGGPGRDTLSTDAPTFSVAPLIRGFEQ